MTYQYLTLDIIATAKEKGEFIDQKTFKTAGKYAVGSLVVTDANMQVLNATSRTSDRFSNPSVISFSWTEMAANMVNWAKLWANWFLMQLANTSIPCGIAKLLKRRATISSLVRSRGYCRKTNSTALLLLKYTIKSNDLEKLLWKVMSAYRNCKELRVQKWTRTSTRDSEIQFPTPCPLLKKCKISAPLPNRKHCLKESCTLIETFVMFWNSQQKKTIF